MEGNPHNPTIIGDGVLRSVPRNSEETATSRRERTGAPQLSSFRRALLLQLHICILHSALDACPCMSISMSMPVIRNPSALFCGALLVALRLPLLRYVTFYIR